ncbi:DUF4116 domain-containing protein [Paraburkholderia aromaticivorans]|uniref:DUF4116 domain-containing protein n=1 Tax=Paraburkholderia aromaticivorans TaxID=2026199 RepID=UPI0038BB99F8
MDNLSQFNFQDDVNSDLNENLIQDIISDKAMIREKHDTRPTLERELESSVQVVLNRADSATRSDKTKLINMIKSCSDEWTLGSHSPDGSAIMDRIPSQFHTDKDVMMTLMGKVNLINDLPAEIEEDVDFMKKAVLKHGSRYFVNCLKTDYTDHDFAVEYARKYPNDVVGRISPTIISTNLEVGICAAKRSLRWLKESELFADKRFFMALVEHYRDDGNFLSRFDPELRADKDIVLKQVSVNPMNITHASVRLRNDWDVAKAAIAACREQEIPSYDITDKFGNSIREAINASGLETYAYFDKLNFRDKLESDLTVYDEPASKIDRSTLSEELLHEIGSCDPDKYLAAQARYKEYEQSLQQEQEPTHRPFKL